MFFDIFTTRHDAERQFRHAIAILPRRTRRHAPLISPPALSLPLTLPDASR